MNVAPEHDCNTHPSHASSESAFNRRAMNLEESSGFTHASQCGSKRPHRRPCVRLRGWRQRTGLDNNLRRSHFPEIENNPAQLGRLRVDGNENDVGGEACSRRFSRPSVSRRDRQKCCVPGLAWRLPLNHHRSHRREPWGFNGVRRIKSLRPWCLRTPEA